MMKFRFQSFFDVATSVESMQVLQWSVGGAEVVNRCRHLFGAYKYFKLGKISVKMVPAATLPVDPQGLSYDEDDPQTVDPRDQQNMGLVRITNGEDVFTNVSSLSEDQQLGVYYSMLLDPRWSKFMLQSGFRRTAYPLYWQVGQLQQDKYPGTVLNIPYDVDSGGLQVGETLAIHPYQNTVADAFKMRSNGGSSARGLFQVGHRGKLGFLPTDYYQEIPNALDGRFTPRFGINNVPEVRVITCVLPKAYKTTYHYRIYVTEEVIFSGIRSSPYNFGGNAYVQGIDQFLSATPVAVNPANPSMLPIITNSKMNNGDQQI